MKLRIPAALRALCPPADDTPVSGVVIDSARRSIVATDGHAIAVCPCEDLDPEKPPRLLPPGDRKEIEIDLDAADCPALVAEPFDWSAAIPNSSPAYRLAVNPVRLAALAAALGADTLILELPAEGQVAKVIPLGPEATEGSVGAVIFEDVPDTQGLLIEAQAQAKREAIAPPVLGEVPERKEITLTFTGKPPAEVREQLKLHDFRWWGKGGFWYAKDVPFRREFANSLIAQLSAA